MKKTRWSHLHLWREFGVQKLDWSILRFNHYLWRLWFCISYRWNRIQRMGPFFGFCRHSFYWKLLQGFQLWGNPIHLRVLVAWALISISSCFLTYLKSTKLWIWTIFRRHLHQLSFRRWTCARFLWIS